MAKKQNVTSKVLELLNKDLNRSAKEIAEAVGTSPSYVYAVKHKAMKKFVEKNKAAIARIAYPNNPVYEDSRLTLSPKVLESIAKTLGPNPVVQPFDKPPQWETLLVGTSPKSIIEMIEPQADLVNHPPHYKAGGIETIDFIEAKKLNYNLGNVVKYITRADLKGNRKQDLEKALWYLNRELSAI